MLHVLFYMLAPFFMIISVYFIEQENESLHCEELFVHKMCVHEYDRFSGCLIVTWYKRPVDLVNTNAVIHSKPFVPFDYLSYTQATSAYSIIFVPARFFRVIQSFYSRVSEDIIMVYDM